MTMAPARIGFLVKTFPRLSETFILNEILGLQTMGWDLQIYSLKRPVEEPVHPGVAQVQAPVRYVPSLRPACSWLEPVKALAAHAGLVMMRPMRYGVALWKYFGRTRAARVKEFVQAGWLAAELEREGITHLHAHFANAPTAVAEIVHWLTGIPFSFTAHAKDIYTTDEGVLARRMATATATLTCTAFNARHLRGIARGRAQVELVYHGIDTERFKAETEQDDAHGKPEIPTVLTVGRFSEKKGLEDLIYACALLRNRGVRFRCVMVGYGALEERLKELRSALILDAVLEMPGRLAQTEVIAQYRRAAVFALPCVVLENGDRDGIPNVLLESMAAGVPVVTTNVSGIAEVVENGRTGWLVKPHDPAMLADAIEYVLTHGAEGARVAASARQRVEAEFSLAASAQRSHEALRRAVICGAGTDDSERRGAAAKAEPSKSNEVKIIDAADSGRVFRGLLRACAPEIVAEGALLASALTAVLLTVLFRVLEPWPLKLIYDFIFRHGHGRGNEHAMFDTVLGPFQHGHRLALIWVSVAALVGFNALAGAFDYLSNVTMGIAVSRVLAKLRARLFLHLQALDLCFHRSHKSGDLMAAVTADIDRLRDVTVSALLPFVSNGLALAAMVTVMLWMNWRLGLLVLVAFPAFYLVVTRITARIERVAREQRQRDGGIAAIAAEAIGAIQTIQAFGLEMEFARRFSGDNQGSLIQGNRAQRLSARLERTVDLFASVTTAGVLLLGASIVLDGRLTAGDLIVFVSYLRNSFKPIRQTAKYLAQIAKALASGGRVLTLLGEKPSIVTRRDSLKASRLRGEIAFEGVSFGYRPGHAVLKEISFVVRPGERVAIVGPSGSGKSTLAALLLRFYDPQAGRIRIDGEDIRSYELASLREQISVVMQDSVLFTGSVRDNIRFGALRTSEEAIERAATKARAAEFIERMPHGYETQVGERGVTLSGGQRQRIAIARAYLRDASIVVLDEPMTGLDTRNRNQVWNALRELSARRTTLTITHDIAEAEEADRILFLCDGRLEEQGTHEELMRGDGGYRALYLQHVHAGAREAAAHAI